MSVLGYPRLHFQGNCAINAATGNNDDVRISIDPVHVALEPFIAAMSDRAAMRWMMEGVRAIQPECQEVRWYLKSGWNYFGNLNFKFVETRINTVVGWDGVASAADPIVGQEVAILGSPFKDGKIRATAHVCDVDPTGSWLTQLFLGHLSVGGDHLGISATHDARAFARWVGWRNAVRYPGEQNFGGGGATWQFALPRECLDFRGSHRSPALDALHRAAVHARGIVVQFSLLFPQPVISDVELIALFQAGDYVSNPVRCLVVGTIGVWNEDELATAPDGRLLLPPIKYTGPATARVQPDRPVVSLNLACTFFEDGYEYPPKKADYGPVWLGYIPEGGGDPIRISEPIDYRYPAYKATAGILDVTYDPRVVTREQLDRGSLVLLSLIGAPGDQPVPLLVEVPEGLVVDTDDRGLYLDVDDRDHVHILVRQRGGPPDHDVPIWIWEYQNYLVPAGPLERAGGIPKLVDQGSGLDPRVSFPAVVNFPKGRTDPLPVPIKALRPGAVALALTLDGRPLPAGYPWDTAAYAGARVMPDDDFSKVPPHRRTSWKFMYKHVWRYYRIVFPAMSRIIPMDSRKDMEAAAREIVARTDPKAWHSTHYMPPSRDLSRGKRKLIMEWADHVDPQGEEEQAEEE
ncbi:hypothetical protein [Aquisphaera insulae]|uniref:hypothetical protein n=1 Tax=Aquisphaera insulae TaxID=2712864 RepID=UPI0013ED85F4|nr:hypothetical protein [Aquisphaera insulae]